MNKSALFISIILIIISLPGISYGSEYSLPEFPETDSEYIVLMDADSGEVLYQNNGDAKCYPASTTKLLTALIAAENSSPSDVVTYSKDAVNSITYGDANVSISVGEQLTMEQSLYCLLLRSANDAAYGIAEHIGGSISGFAALMNDKAASYGASGTHFTNPSGLSDEFHYTTPYDMALIGRACFNNKYLMNIISYSKVYSIPPTNKSNFTRYYRHRYQMVKGGIYEYEYSCGGKTGYTDAAGNCLVSFAEKDGLRLICVIMNSGEETRYTDTIKLFEYYFNNYYKLYLDEYDDGITAGGIDVLKITSGLDSASDTTLSFGENAYLLVPKGTSAESLTGIVTYSNSPAYAGDEGGFACISFYCGQLNAGNITVYCNIKTSGVIPGTDGVPLNSGSVPVPEPDIIYVNTIYVWCGTAALVLVAGIIIFIMRRKRKHFNYASKKLHF